MKRTKTIYIIILLMFALVSCLGVGYAALSSTLIINGTTNVKKNTWDVYFDNVYISPGSVLADSNPSISSTKDTVNFVFSLNEPGDYYEFTVDIVNSGTLDAVIESISKTPELTEAQQKYLSYVIQYENGDSIATKQALAKNSFVRVLVRVEFKRDITVAELPSTGQSLPLSFTVNYTQSDETGNVVTNSGIGSVVRILKGDGTALSDEVCFGRECFYTIITQGDNVMLLAKYNLYVGYEYYETGPTLLDYPSGVQDKRARGFVDGPYPFVATSTFSNTNYWSSLVSAYPANVYNSSSNLYGYLENYKTYLTNMGITINEIRPINLYELQYLGCRSDAGTCEAAPSWVYQTSYRTGTAFDSDRIWQVVYGGEMNYSGYYINTVGVRPLIIIPKSVLEIS